MAMSERRSFRRERPGPPEGAGLGLTNFREKADFLWSLAEILRGDYKQSEYGKVILPLVVTGTGKDLLEAAAQHVLVEKTGTYDVRMNFPMTLYHACAQRASRSYHAMSWMPARRSSIPTRAGGSSRRFTSSASP